MRVSLTASKALCAAAAFAACSVLLQGCSTARLAYNQVPHLFYWKLHSYLDLSGAQTEQVRDELGDLHQWHREAMLPRHAELVHKVQQQLPSTLSPDQACSVYSEARLQFDRVVAQAEPKLAWLATRLSSAQILHLQQKQNESNIDWKKEWMDTSPQKLRTQRFQQLLSRTETFYGPLQEPQKAALGAWLASSTFDPQRTYAERLRRQEDLVQVLHAIAEDRTHTERARALLRGYIARFQSSPDAAYQRYAKALVEEGCEGFSRLHNAMTAAQKSKAVQSLQGYKQDFWALAER